MLASKAFMSKPKPLWYFACQSLASCSSCLCDETRRDYAFRCLMYCYLSEDLRRLVGISTYFCGSNLMREGSYLFLEPVKKRCEPYIISGWKTIALQWQQVCIIFVQADLYDKGIVMEDKRMWNDYSDSLFKMCCALYYCQIK